MTRTELHELVDIVMDARERTDRNMHLLFKKNLVFFYTGYRYIHSEDYFKFSDFTQAVKEYIDGL